MSLHYLDPSDEPRECPGCIECFPPPAGGERHGAPRTTCGGTGRLGNPDGARVMVYDRRKREAVGPSRFFAVPVNPEKPLKSPCGPYPTEAEALEAARKAHREGQR